MRILIITDGLPGGGAEKALLTLAQGLISQKYRVSIFSLQVKCDYILPKGVDYHVIVDKTYHIWQKLTEINRRARKLDKLIQFSQKNNGSFDLIISHLHKTDRIVSRSKVLSPNRVWFCLHTIFSLGYLSNRKGFSRWLKRRKIHNLYQNRNIIAVSHGILEDIYKIFKIIPRKAKVIYNPFDFNIIRRMAKEPCELAGYNYLIHIGRLNKNKRQDRLLKAYAKSGIKIPLVIMGSGNNIVLKQLKSLAKVLHITDRVIFKAFNTNPYPYILHASMLILSSDSEGFGNVLVESLICNTPVVSTLCPGGPIEILNGDLSIGLSNLQSSSLARTMQIVYNQPPTILPSHLQPYMVDTICQQYISLIEN